MIEEKNLVSYDHKGNWWDLYNSYPEYLEAFTTWEEGWDRRYAQLDENNT